MEFKSQSGQDKFVLSVLKNKYNGIFVEIGSQYPEKNNNTYVMEKTYNWTGIMVEYVYDWLQLYKIVRPNSLHIMEDATKVNFLDEFEMLDFPKHIDYLQIDLEVINRSTLTVLENLDKNIFDKYKFAVITFEHDIYTGDYFNTRNLSREIFNKHGYYRVFSDVMDQGGPYEDWYIHPELVDMEYIYKIKSDESLEFTDILKRL